ncbi:MAG: helix-turn-helix transcriptional regulator [Dehalococcoidales bacterium]|nr:helix-turn-helix transcriptional regulator [Dehalococcoidales bacterium]
MNGHLKQIRETRVLSRKDLAQQSNVDESTIFRAERGQTKLRPSTVRKLAQALGVPPDELISEQGRLVL